MWLRCSRRGTVSAIECARTDLLMDVDAQRRQDDTPSTPRTVSCAIAFVGSAKPSYSLRLVVLAAFALGSTGGECSPPFLRLDYEKGCERAAVVANKTYTGSLSLEGYPAGCYWHTVDGSVYYFIRDLKHAVVTVNSFVRQMCAGKADSRTAEFD